MGKTLISVEDILKDKGLVDMDHHSSSKER